MFHFSFRCSRIKLLWLMSLDFTLNGCVCVCICVCSLHRWLFRSSYIPRAYLKSLSQHKAAASNIEEFLHSSSSHCTTRGRPPLPF